VNDDESAFTRLYYYGTVHMGMTPAGFWMMAFGLFLDLWECHKQYMGWEKPLVERGIDDVIPV
jgi:hypothetical protein